MLTKNISLRPLLARIFLAPLPPLPLPLSLLLPLMTAEALSLLPPQGAHYRSNDPSPIRSKGAVWSILPSKLRCFPLLGHDTYPSVLADNVVNGPLPLPPCQGW